MPELDAAAITELCEDTIRRAGEPSISVAVGQGCEVVYARGFGHVDRARRSHVTADTPYLLASVTKPITATAVGATIGHGQAFQHGRQFAAGLGLVPKQHSTGGKTVLGRMTKHGNVYLRTLLIHGARAVLQFSAKRRDQKSRWVEKVRSGAGTFRDQAVLERARAASAGVADSGTGRAARDRPATADAGLGCGCLCDHLHVPSAKGLTHGRTVSIIPD